MDVPAYPVLFHESAARSRPSAANYHPAYQHKVDYEAELAIIIASVVNISQKKMPSPTCWLLRRYDVSARDLQFRTPQWTTGKMLDTFCPFKVRAGDAR